VDAYEGSLPVRKVSGTPSRNEGGFAGGFSNGRPGRR